MTSDIPLEIDCHDVSAKLRSGENFVLLDCREPDEYAVARIAGARLLPMSELAARIAELEPYRDVPIAVHCHHGGRSLKVTHWLRGQGYKDRPKHVRRHRPLVPRHRPHRGTVLKRGYEQTRSLAA